jgi:hypothetical protein
MRENHYELVFYYFSCARLLAINITGERIPNMNMGVINKKCNSIQPRWVNSEDITQLTG